MVFQSYALYPHMTVRRNIEFPLRSRKVPAAERDQLVRDAAESLDLGELLDRKPAQLSGGQRQRVALARAIVRRPQAFLMDEPLSNLDAKLRVQTRAELVELQRRLAATFVYVTHDQVEAMTMGHRIAVLDAGVLQQVGAPQDVYARPANLFVARFIGSPPMNTVTGRVDRVDGDAGRAAPGRARPARPELAAGGRGQWARRGGDRGAARGPALRRHRRDPGAGERGRVARARAPRRVPPRRPAARDRAPGRPRGGAGGGEHARSSSPTPTALHVFDPEIRRADRRLTRWRASASRPARRRLRRRERGLAYLLLIPSLLIFGVFVF